MIACRFSTRPRPRLPNPPRLCPRSDFAPALQGRQPARFRSPGPTSEARTRPRRPFRPCITTRTRALIHQGRVHAAGAQGR
jgi:hypothetical protein